MFVEEQKMSNQFMSSWNEEIRTLHNLFYKNGDYEGTIRGINFMYGLTFEELQAEVDTKASKEWAFDQETADYFFLAEGFDPETGEFLA